MGTIIGSKEKYETLLSEEWLEEQPNLDRCLKDMEIRVKK